MTSPRMPCTFTTVVDRNLWISVYTGIMKRRSYICTVLFAIAWSVLAATSGADTIDFDDLDPGRIVGPNNPGGFGTVATFSDVTFTAVQGDPPSTDNAGSTKYLVVFDSNNPQPQTDADGFAQSGSPGNPAGQSAGNHPNGYDGDPDLASPWPGSGNLNGVDSGNILVVAENTTDIWHNDKVGNIDGTAGEYYDTDDLVDVPDDWVPGGSTAGALRLEFSQELLSFGFDIADIEPASACCVEFFSGSFAQADRVGRIFFDANYTETPGIDTGYYTWSTSTNADNGNPFYDGSIVYGDSTANRFQPVAASELASAFGGNGRFDHVQINFTTSVGFDSFTFQPIPEPGSLLFAVLAFTGIAFRRRPRRQMVC